MNSTLLERPEAAKQFANLPARVVTPTPPLHVREPGKNILRACFVLGAEAQMDGRLAEENPFDQTTQPLQRLNWMEGFSKGARFARDDQETHNLKVQKARLQEYLGDEFPRPVYHDEESPLNRDRTFAEPVAK